MAVLILIAEYPQDIQRMVFAPVVYKQEFIVQVRDSRNGF